MRKLKVLILACCIFTTACSQEAQPEESDQNKLVEYQFDISTFDLQGHRGCRGLMPENTIPAFRKAIDLNVTTIELDVIVTGDSQLLVSHEPWFSDEICNRPGGGEVGPPDPNQNNFFKLKYRQIAAWDCGSLPHPRFPSQETTAVSKPLLDHSIDSIETYSKIKKKPGPNFNIEIKANPEWDNIYQPKPEIAVDLLLAMIEKWELKDRTTIQSFDFRVLEIVHSIAPEIQLAMLVENREGFEINLNKLDFVPQIYSCDHTLLTKNIVAEIHAAGLRVIPWTVNDPERMRELIDWKVDGLITDYPDRGQQILAEY